MTSIADEYVALMREYLDGKHDLEAFSIAYFNKFSNEDRPMDAMIFETLDGLFGDIDSCTSDAILLSDDPSFYLSESDLKERIISAIEELSKREVG